MKHKSGGDFSTGGGFLRDPGTYHFCITDIDEIPTNKSGALIDNAAFKVNVEALASTATGQEHKQTDICFFHPKPSDKNEGAFARKKIDRFLLSVCLMTDEDKDKEVDIDLTKAIGRQFIAKMELDKDEKFLQVAFADIFHVDDPAVKETPKNEQALKLIPAALRKIGSRAPAPAKNGTGPTAKKAKEPAASSQAPAPQTVVDDWKL